MKHSRKKLCHAHDSQKRGSTGSDHSALPDSSIPPEKLSKVETAALETLGKIITNLEGTRTSLDITILELRQVHDLAAKLTATQNEPWRPAYVG